jgi:diadenosine tetraphosphatase ApaH/serine/threonine PP2A family protein phosphatase
MQLLRDVLTYYEWYRAKQGGCWYLNSYPVGATRINVWERTPPTNAAGKMLQAKIYQYGTKL